MNLLVILFGGKNFLFSTETAKHCSRFPHAFVFPSIIPSLILPVESITFLLKIEFEYVWLFWVWLITAWILVLCFTHFERTNHWSAIGQAISIFDSIGWNTVRYHFCMLPTHLHFQKGRIRPLVHWWLLGQNRPKSQWKKTPQWPKEQLT